MRKGYIQVPLETVRICKSPAENAKLHILFRKACKLS